MQIITRLAPLKWENTEKSRQLNLTPFVKQNIFSTNMSFLRKILITIQRTPSTVTITKNSETKVITVLRKIKTIYMTSAATRTLNLILLNQTG